tara:strand:- start:872 stop:1255 length:384 start_codon:yes stop_codon:yes gene_type:complete
MGAVTALDEETLNATLATRAALAAALRVDPATAIEDLDARRPREALNSRHAAQEWKSLSVILVTRQEGPNGEALPGEEHIMPVSTQAVLGQQLTTLVRLQREMTISGNDETKSPDREVLDETKLQVP